MPLNELFWEKTSDVHLGMEVAVRGRCAHCLSAMSRTMGVLSRVAEIGTDTTGFAKIVDVPAVLCEDCRPVYEEDVAAEVAIAEIALTARNPQTLDAMRKWATIERA